MFLRSALPEQTSCGSSGRRSSASWPCPPAGSSSRPPHESRRTDYRLQTERNTYLKEIYIHEKSTFVFPNL